MKALIAMSGGVDSSVAALLMLERGCACVGCTMKLYDNEDAGLPPERSCCSLDDVEDAWSVAHRMGIPHYTFNYKDEFRHQVMHAFFSAYEAGRTPNPCVDCNRYLKFGCLLQRAKELGCELLVTGHYVRTFQREGQFYLRKALDGNKDQSYFLYMLSQEQLRHTCFPLGELTKGEVRAIAESRGFVNAKKPDSQDICFVPDGDYAAVLERHTGNKPRPGPFLDLEGHVLGTHRGIIHYTVGQRRGLGLSFDQPYYVIRIDAAANAVVLGPKDALFSDTVLVPSFHWISGQAPEGPIRCQAKIRYRHPEQPATLTPLPSGGARIVFDEPQRAITPGQSAVAYDGDIVLGGGEIG